MAYPTDSPLSITASIAGILTFVFAIAASIYLRISYLANADQEYFQVKTSLSWYKTESTWLADLVRAHSESLEKGSLYAQAGKEYSMYVFVMEQLGVLEERLLELLTEAEIKAASSLEGRRWTLVPRGVRGVTGIAMSWLPVREKALELVRQRDALGSRVLFAQMSLLGSRVRELEARAGRREKGNREGLRELVGKVERVEEMIWRGLHRERVGGYGRVEAFGRESGFDERDRSTTKVEGENEETASESDGMEREYSPPPPFQRKPGIPSRYYTIPSI